MLQFDQCLRFCRKHLKNKKKTIFHAPVNAESEKHFSLFLKAATEGFFVPCRNKFCFLHFIKKNQSRSVRSFLLSVLIQQLCYQPPDSAVSQRAEKCADLHHHPGGQSFIFFYFSLSSTYTHRKTDGTACLRLQSPWKPLLSCSLSLNSGLNMSICSVCLIMFSWVCCNF